MPEPKELPPGIGGMTIIDLIAKLGGLSQPALWLIVVLMLFKSSGCELPIEFKRPTLPPAAPRLSTVDVPNAIGRISMGNVGCTATIIGPIADDDKEISILTAAHCIKVGTVGSMKLKDGRTFKFKCVTRNADADCAWLVAARPEGVIPFAFLATTLPEKGSPVWHMGYGVDNPGNLEKGTYHGVNGDGKQCMYTLSVSSGDSGGGIISTGDGHVLSPVCCTSRLSGTGNVWGSTPQHCSAIRPGRVVVELHEPLVQPVLTLPHPDWPEPPAL